MCTFKVFYTNLHRYVCIPAGFTPKIVLIQPISGATFLHAIIWGCWVTTRIYGSIPFSFLFLDTKSIVISSIPMRIHLHVLLTLYTSLFVIFGLFLSAQSMPLKIKRGRKLYIQLYIGIYMQSVKQIIILNCILTVNNEHMFTQTINLSTKPANHPQRLVEWHLVYSYNILFPNYPISEYSKNCNERSGSFFLYINYL